jgi:hypothetical protein
LELQAIASIFVFVTAINKATTFLNQLYMRTNCFLVAFLLLFSNITFSQSNKTYPVFALNDSFSHTQPKGSKITPKNYQLSNLSGFKLDCTKYEFSLVKRMNGGKNPDAIFIVAKSGNYIIELNVTGETLVDKSTMQSLDNPPKKFSVFEKGDTPILGIGTLKMKDGTASMTTYWVSMIDVK